MKFYKEINEGYIASVSTQTGDGNGNITEAEYNAILSTIRAKPVAPTGYDYMLRADTLEWELVELPPIPEDDTEATVEDYEAVLQEMGI